jgi:hypothetical protein
MEKMKPGQISAKRAYEISDSLMDKSKKLKEFAYPQIRIGKATIKNKVADKQVSSSTSNPKTWGNTLSGRDRLNIGQKALKEASADSSKAVRLKSRADQAMAKANTIKPTKDSTEYFKNASESHMRLASEYSKVGSDAIANKLVGNAKSAFESQKRQANKGKAGYDANGYKRDIPLPSSEGMMSKIASGLSSLFGK